MRLFPAALAATCLAIAAPATAATLVNGDFEQPGGAVRDQITTGSVTGWTYAGGSYDIYEEQNAMDGLNAADGSHYVSFGHNGYRGGSLSQTFNTTPGVTYTITYSVAEQQGDDSSQILRASVQNGASTVSFDNTGLGSVFAAGGPLVFTATDSTATLTFFDATPAGGGGGSNLALDAVRLIDPTVSAVPEPATWAMMLVGFLGLGGALRSRRLRPATAWR